MPVTYFDSCLRSSEFLIILFCMDLHCSGILIHPLFRSKNTYDDVFGLSYM